MRHTSAFTAVYDACVLYPAPLRDFLIRLALTGTFRARWTARIHDEWTRAVLRSRPELAGALARTRSLMDEAVSDCLVEGYEALAAGIELPDPDDAHVVAAAVRCGANVIVTFNLKDFPRSQLQPLGIDVQHPDEFADYLFDLHPDAVLEAARKQRTSLKAPPVSAERYFDVLLRQGLTRTVRNLSGFKALL